MSRHKDPHRHPHKRGFQWRLWGAPIAISLITAVGLIAGLIGDGAWDAASWIGLGLPVAACVWHGWLEKRSERSDMSDGGKRPRPTP